MTQSIHKIKLNGENWVKAFFGSTAVVSVVLISLITLFLLKEGLGFFGSYQKELALYRESGMEFAEVVSEQHNSLTLIYRYLENILANESKFFEELPQIDFGRIAAQSAKQVISSRVREAEKNRQYEDFIDKQGQILSGIIKRLQITISNPTNLVVVNPFIFIFPDHLNDLSTIS